MIAFWVAIFNRILLYVGGSLFALYGEVECALSLLPALLFDVRFFPRVESVSLNKIALK